MRSAGAGAIALLVSAAVMACSAPQKRRASPGSSTPFECNSRRAEYMVVGGFVAAEAGISMVCDGSGPRIISWRTETGDNRVESTHGLSTEQFEATWEQIDSTGWRFLEKDCGNRKKKGEPIYTIGIADHASQVELACVGKELPFPYDRLVNELDLRAAGFGNDAGDAR
jgi:hypothetical protein